MPAAHYEWPVLRSKPSLPLKDLKILNRTRLKCSPQDLVTSTTAVPTPSGSPAPDGYSYIELPGCAKGSPRDQGITFDRDAAIDGIKDFCKKKPNMNRGSCVEGGMHSIDFYPKPGDRIYMSAHLTGDPECHIAPGDDWDKTYPGYEDNCKFALQTALDDCEPGMTDKKGGGWNRLRCVEFQLFGVHKGYKGHECP